MPLRPDHDDEEVDDAISRYELTVTLPPVLMIEGYAVDYVGTDDSPYGYNRPWRFCCDRCGKIFYPLACDGARSALINHARRCEPS